MKKFLNEKFFYQKKAFAVLQTASVFFNFTVIAFWMLLLLLLVNEVVLNVQIQRITYVVNSVLDDFEWSRNLNEKNSFFVIK